MRRYLIPILIGIILLGFGSCYIWFEVMNMSFVNEAPSSYYENKTETIEFPLLEKQKYYFEGDDVNIVTKVDPRLEDKIVLTASYYPNFGKFKYYKLSHNEAFQSVNLTMDKSNQFESFKKINKILMNDLKEKKLHNYSLLFEANVTIFIPLGKEEQVVLESIKEYKDFYDVYEDAI